MDHMPKVQILLSTYNGEKYIKDQLTSILNNGYSNVYISIRDDGSSDKTRDILAEFESIVNLSISYENNIGVVNSFYKLLASANKDCKYFAFCDQDDIWKQGKIDRALQFVESLNQDIPILYCSNIDIVDQDLKHICFSKLNTTKPSFNNALVENIVTGCTMVINNKARDIMLKYVPENAIMHDWWAYLVVSCFGKVIYDTQPTILYRQHEKNSIGYPSNIWIDICQRIKCYCGRGGEKKLKKQAFEFYLHYKNMMSQEHLRFLEEFIEERPDMWKRVIYAIRGPLFKNNIIDNLILKILIILDKV
jgi:glycosyltransferase involved in cell wall biosynthesis